MSWFDLAGPLAVALLFMVLLGLPVSIAAGQRGFLSFALSPLFAATAIALCAVAGEAVGVAWGWWSPLAMTAIMTALVLVARILARSARPRETALPGLANELPYWAAALLAVPLLTMQMVRVFIRPDSFAQRFDNVFHLNAIRYIIEEGHASSLTIGRMTAGEVPIAFYPAAFHDAASLVMHAFPATLTAPTNAVLIVISAVVWPLSCLALAKTVLPGGWATALGAAAACSALPAFPMLFLWWGVLYPNLYGLALVPAALALAAQFLRLGSARMAPWMALLLLALAAPGLALSHPNAVLTLAVAVAPALAWHVLREVGRLRKVGSSALRLSGSLGLAVAFAVVVPAVWINLRPSAEAAWWPPVTTPARAVGEALLNAPFGDRAAWLLSGLMLLGLVLAPRFRRAWLSVAWLLMTGFWTVVAGWPRSGLRDLLTGVWYNDPYRLAAALTLLAVPLVAMGCHAMALWLVAVKRRLAPRGWLAGGQLCLVVGLVVTVPVIALTQKSDYMAEAVAEARSAYVLAPDSPMITSDEWALLNRVPDQVPPDSVVATDPWNGSSLLYAFTGVPTTTTHVFHAETDDLEILRLTLDEAPDAAGTCAVVQRMGIDYVLDFGQQNFHDEPTDFPGFDAFAGSPGFREIDRQGAAVLYAVEACD